MILIDDITLKDNPDIGSGGVAFVGEKLSDFLADTAVSDTIDMPVLNTALAVSGIMPIGLHEITVKRIDADSIKKACECLADNGIDADETETVLEALLQILIGQNITAEVAKERR